MGGRTTKEHRVSSLCLLSNDTASRSRNPQRLATAFSAGNHEEYASHAAHSSTTQPNDRHFTLLHTLHALGLRAKQHHQRHGQQHQQQQQQQHGQQQQQRPTLQQQLQDEAGSEGTFGVPQLLQGHGLDGVTAQPDQLEAELLEAAATGTMFMDTVCRAVYSKRIGHSPAALLGIVLIALCSVWPGACSYVGQGGSNLAAGRAGMHHKAASCIVQC